jgi:hypothetical protein
MRNIYSSFGVMALTNGLNVEFCVQIDNTYCHVSGYPWQETVGCGLDEAVLFDDSFTITLTVTTIITITLT